MGAIPYQKVGFFFIFGGRIPTPCTNRGEILHSQADPRVRRPRQVSRGENLTFDLRLISILAACAFRNPAGNNLTTTKLARFRNNRYWTKNDTVIHNNFVPQPYKFTYSNDVHRNNNRCRKTIIICPECTEWVVTQNPHFMLIN